MKIREGDLVKVIKGKDRGREGTVIKALPQKEAVYVEGLNIYKKHLRPSAQNREGGIIELPKPLLASKLMIVCPHCQKAVRVGFKLADNRKVRVCKKCQGEL